MNTNEQELGSLLLFFSRLLANVLEYWKLFIVVVSLPTIMAIITTLWILEPNFTSRAVVRVPESNSLGNLGSNLGSDPILGAFLGTSFRNKNEINTLWTILSSTETHNQVLKHFNLATHYEFKSRFHADLLKSFRENFSLVLNDENMLVISVTDKDPEIARQIVRFILDRADSAYNHFNSTLARQSKDFFELRMQQVLKSLDSLEFAFAEFQKANSLFLPEIQLSTTFEQLANLQFSRDQLQVELDLQKKLYGDASSRLDQLRIKHRSLDRMLNNALHGHRSKTGLLSLEQAPQLVFEYMRYDLEIRVQQGIYRLLRQKFEENALEEVMNMRNIQIIEEPWANDKRSKPPRTVIVILIFGMSFCLAVALCSLCVRIRASLANPNSLLKNEIIRMVRVFFPHKQF